MSSKEFKDKTLTDLFNNLYVRKKRLKGEKIQYSLGEKLEGMLFRGVGQHARRYLESDIVSETFLELSKMNPDKFYDYFFDNPNYLEATFLTISRRVGILNTTNKNTNLPPRPNGCLKDLIEFGSSLKSTYNNVIEPFERNADYEGMGSEGVSSSVLPELLPEDNDKNEVFEYLKSEMTEEEFKIIDMLTNQTSKPGRKPVDLQHKIDAVKAKMKAKLEDRFPNYYTQRAWSIGLEMSKYKNEKYKYVDETHCTPN